MPRPIPVQIKHCVVLAFEKALCLHALYAQVEDNLRSVTVYMFVDEHDDVVYDVMADASTTLDALFPALAFNVRVLATQGRPAEDLAEGLLHLNQKYKVY